MSVLTFLFFASVLYFTTVNTTPIPTTPEAYQEDVRNLLDIVNKGLEDYLMPIIGNLDQEDQENVKTVALNGFAGYVNYVIFMANEDLEESHPETDLDPVVNMGVDDSVPVPYPNPNGEGDLAS